MKLGRIKVKPEFEFVKKMCALGLVIKWDISLRECGIGLLLGPFLLGVDVDWF